MAKIAPCQHRRRALDQYRAVKLKLDENGQVLSWGDTPDMDKWAVVEDRRCIKCGHVGIYFARKGFGEATERKALARYGIKGTALPAPPNHKVKPPVEAPLTSWPFPVSAHADQPTKRGKAAASAATQ